MKKKLLNWGIVISVFAVIAISSCKKTSEVILACPEAITTYGETLEAFTDNPNKQTCEANKKALQNYINVCTIGDQYQELYDNTDCSIYD